MRASLVGLVTCILSAIACGGEEGAGSGGGSGAGGAGGAAPTGHCATLGPEDCAARPDCLYAAVQRPEACGEPDPARCHAKSECHEPGESCASEQVCSELLYDCGLDDCSSCETFHVCSESPGGA